jgi:hypothetical protein
LYNEVQKVSHFPILLVTWRLTTISNLPYCRSSFSSHLENSWDIASHIDFIISGDSSAVGRMSSVFSIRSSIVFLDIF